MTTLRHAGRTLLEKLGLQVIRRSRSKPIGQLTGARNVLNHPAAAPRGAMEGLGHATLALQLEWLLREFQIDCVLDVGANHGQFAGELRELGYREQIASFEPLAGCVATLRRLAAADPAWTIFPCGLGRTPGRQELTHFADDTFSSLHPINEAAPAEFAPFVVPTGSETIELRTIDDVWAEAVAERGASRVLLKTDTQGHDLEVLRGAQRHLADCAVVVCEVSFAPVYSGTAGYRDLLAYLEEHGFECTGINALSYRADRPALIEANAVFINPALARRLEANHPPAVPAKPA